VSSLVSIGIVEKNSVAYVNAAFDSLEKGHVVVPFRSLVLLILHSLQGLRENLREY